LRSRAIWRTGELILGKVSAAAEALTGLTTPKGKRVQTLNRPGSETGGQVATWGRATSNRVDAMRVKWAATGTATKSSSYQKIVAVVPGCSLLSKNPGRSRV